MMSQKRRIAGFTLPEILVVVGILGVLMALLFPNISQILPKADRIVCMSHLRELWLHFAPCATDDEGWPQLPQGVAAGSREEERFWLDYSSNHLGVPVKDWHCPSIDRASRRASSSAQLPLIHYLPTLFDARSGTPNKWSSMPWFSEIGDVHGGGNLTIRADGTIVSSLPKP